MSILGVSSTSEGYHESDETKPIHSQSTKSLYGCQEIAIHMITKISGVPKILRALCLKCRG